MYKNHTHTQHNTIQVAKVKQEREEKKHFHDNYNLVYSDTTKFQLFDIFSMHCLGLFERDDSIEDIKKGIN